MMPPQPNARPFPLLRCMRPKQWTKNGLLFSGLFLNARFGIPALWWDSLGGFVVFCLLSGSVYIINDLKDIEADRRHPKKRFRPLAAGEVSPTAATFFAFLLVAVALAWAWLFGPRFWIIAASYWALVLAYSLGLKHVVILDVMALAAGFVLRALAGIYVIEASWSVAVHSPLRLTGWFLACTMFLALFIALCKRRAEMVNQQEAAESTRRVLREYSVPLLDQLIGMAATLTVMTYALYCVQQEKQDLLLTLPFVLYGVMRFLWHVYRNDDGGAPELLLYHDKTLLACVALWMGVLSLILLR